MFRLTVPQQRPAIRLHAGKGFGSKEQSPDRNEKVTKIPIRTESPCLTQEHNSSRQPCTFVVFPMLRDHMLCLPEHHQGPLLAGHSH